MRSHNAVKPGPQVAQGKISTLPFGTPVVVRHLKINRCEISLNQNIGCCIIQYVMASLRQSRKLDELVHVSGIWPEVCPVYGNRGARSVLARHMT